MIKIEPLSLHFKCCSVFPNDLISSERVYSIFMRFLLLPFCQDHQGEFDWDEKTQGMVLGSFFWGYIVTQIPGGILVKWTGSKWMIGIGCLSTALFTLLTPIAARYSVYALIAVRVLEGLGEVSSLLCLQFLEFFMIYL